MCGGGLGRKLLERCVFPVRLDHWLSDNCLDLCLRLLIGGDWV